MTATLNTTTAAHNYYTDRCYIRGMVRNQALYLVLCQIGDGNTCCVKAAADCDEKDVT